MKNTIDMTRLTDDGVKAVEMINRKADRTTAIGSAVTRWNFDGLRLSNRDLTAIADAMENANGLRPASAWLAMLRAPKINGRIR
jgi:hypothetical protein